MNPGGLNSDSFIIYLWLSNIHSFGPLLGQDKPFEFEFQKGEYRMQTQPNKLKLKKILHSKRTFRKLIADDVIDDVIDDTFDDVLHIVDDVINEIKQLDIKLLFYYSL
ncbi:10812_t:CDS:2 [Dentiscutata heterogama]|uniref:10812_t:CDS:1 n=1 Tax=Dentiscutata heterogama TaxID=1316150 RepID=A0ACA9JVP8_9GLOM|nr:10812_t:CDS:2 [Dentiscutata heterogama]